MVDLDNDKEVEPPPDAKYLAQKNNRAEVETPRHRHQLEKAQKGAQGSEAPSDRQDTEVGDDKAKIAQLDDEKSALGRKAPEVTPHVDPELSQPEPPRAAEAEVAAGAARCAPSRARADARDRRPVAAAHRRRDDPHAERAGRARPAHRRRPPDARQEDEAGADRPRTTNTCSAPTPQAERRLAQTERSKKVGRFQQRIGRVQSSLENFIPEVKPGNQTALNTRAAPFAAYIARMHRSIHKLWGFGMLEEWDEKSSSNPFNNPNLLTTLEMRAEPGRHGGQGHGGEDVGLHALRRRRDRRRVQRRPLSRSAARDPLEERQDLPALALLSGRAPVRDIGGRLRSSSTTRPRTATRWQPGRASARPVPSPAIGGGVCGSARKA